MTQQLPYDIHPRRDTGQYNARLGVWLLIASSIMLLAALYSGYAMLRYTSGEWNIYQIRLSMTLGILAVVLQTLIALLSPWNWLFARQGSFGMVWCSLGASVIISLGAIFTCAYQQHVLAQQGFTPVKHNFYALFHLLTGLQILFLIIVMVSSIVFLLAPGNKQKRLMNRMECLGIFVHFVAVSAWLHFTLFFVL